MILSKQRNLQTEKKTKEIQDVVEVSLAHFAAIADLTEAEFSKKMFKMLETGNLMGLLKINAQYELGEWITHNFLDNQKEFLIIFRLSLNRIRDVALYCRCKVSDIGIFVKDAIPGHIGHLPIEMTGLEGFELSFCDMEPSI